MFILLWFSENHEHTSITKHPLLASTVHLPHPKTQRIPNTKRRGRGSSAGRKHAAVLQYMERRRSTRTRARKESGASMPSHLTLSRKDRSSCCTTSAAATTKETRRRWLAPRVSVEMRAKTERGVEGAHRIPAAGAQLEQDHTTACGGVDSPGRTSKCRRRTTRPLSSLSVFNALREDVFCSDPCKSTASFGRCTCPKRREQVFFWNITILLEKNIDKF